MKLVKKAIILGLMLAAFNGIAAGPVLVPRKTEKPPPSPTHLHPRIPEQVYLDGQFSLGLSRPEFSAKNSPTLLQWGLALSGGYRFYEEREIKSEFFAGLSASWRFIGQYSELDARFGNARGHRLIPIAPLLGVIVDREFVAKLSLQFLGSYNISQPTADGGEYAYNKPFGVNVSVLYRVGRFVGLPRLSAGGEFEYVKYRGRSLSTYSGALSGGLSTMWLGLGVAYEL